MGVSSRDNMMRLKHLLSVLAICGLSSILPACVPKYAITTTYMPLQLGDTTVNVVLHEAATPGLTYLNIHDNENTSVAAALDVIGEYGGRVIELKHSGDRNITFHLSDTTYEFDPNRMFTEQGRITTLEQFSDATDEALAVVRAFADEVLQRLDPAGLDVVVTLHNTAQGTYSVFVYTPGGDHEKEAEISYVSDKRDPNDFYFVTDYDTYEQLSRLEHNVVLQDNANATDDGSLSVWSAQQHIVYVNVEAQNGHQREQVVMLHNLHEIFYTDGEAVVP